MRVNVDSKNDTMRDRKRWIEKRSRNKRKEKGKNKYRYQERM